MADGFLEGTLLNFYEELQPRESFLDFPNDREISLSNCMKEKQPERARALIESIIEENRERNRGSGALIGVLYYDLLSALLKTASETGLSPGSFWGSEEAERFAAASSGERTDMLGELAGRICAGLTVPETSHASALKARLLSFIHENYSRTDLSLNLIARNFNISPQYLSSFFKSQVGKNYMDYVTQYRLQKSLELLEGSSLPVRKIAERVGYTDAGNFIRVFKKYYFVTPGQYRDGGHSGTEC